MPVTEVQKLQRKIRRLENKLAEMDAEVGVYQMMIHDIPAEHIFDAVAKKYPALAKRWSKP